MQMFNCQLSIVNDSEWKRNNENKKEEKEKRKKVTLAVVNKCQILKRSTRTKTMPLNR